MTTNQAMQNIRTLYAIRMVKALVFPFAVIIPFFQSLGLNMTEIFLTQTVFSLTVVACEVPSGYLADRIGRTFALRFGAILIALGFGVYAISTGLGPVLLAEMLIGVGLAAMSGSDSALARETLAAAGRAGRAYLRFEARSNAWGDLAAAIGLISGGLMAIGDLRAPFIAQAVVTVLLIPLAWRLVEQPRRQIVAGHPGRDLARIVRYSLHGHPEIKWLIIYGAVVATSTYVMAWLLQPYFQAVGLPIGWFGVVSAALFGVQAIFAYYVEPYERWLGKRRLLISFIPIAVLSYLVVAATIGPFGIALMVGFYFVRAMARPVFRDYLNDLVGDRIRATVLSVDQLISRLLYASFGPLVGYVMDLWSLPTALLFSAGLFGVIGLAALLMMQRNKVL